VVAVTPSPPSAGDEIPPQCHVIEVRVAELRQLFNAIDPSPFREKDLDPKAEEFIVSWAGELPRDAPLALLVYLERPADLEAAFGILKSATGEYFRQRAGSARRRLRTLLRTGRVSLVIGVAFVFASAVAVDLLGRVTGSGLGTVLGESLVIGAWVALWRPLEIFLYDWWPIRAEARLYDRLSVMPVRIVPAAADGSLDPSGQRPHAGA
jgi:hypothetical protein